MGKSVIGGAWGLSCLNFLLDDLVCCCCIVVKHNLPCNVDLEFDLNMSIIKVVTCIHIMGQ